jgi:SEL1 protein
VSLSLARLNARFIWSYLTGGETGADASSFWSIGSGKASSGRGSVNKDASSGDATAGGKEQAGGQGANKDENSDDGSGNGWDLNEIGKKSVKKWTNQKQTGLSDDGDYDDVEGFQQRHHRQPGEAEGEDDGLYMDDEELVESIVIIGLCMVVGYLMYVRQFRFGNQQQPQQQQQQQQGNQNNDGNNNNNNGNQQQQHQPPMGGLPGDPNAPGRFAYYAAGG